ncbi:DUF429 domain-containing protein [Natronosalvus rutilus]|uniref:DUF429 domain-containing protein n=1 Tax=Natronosalvus rutilus TaxID=2953753 RepID=A0A9E7NEM7_9EURY|nr:DUF429 domain-containing protein [Natronosalvus rutilus]UTF55594.1 DUF429 domain-containing protein [Natronosalvus rutilus]
MSYIGVDWASKGWFAVSVNEGCIEELGFYPTIFNLWNQHSTADRILIDIPIGLCTDQRRECDVEAKEMLNPHRGSSLFYTPIRDAVQAENIEAAKAEQSDLDFSVQNQAWALVPRIREVDEFLAMFADELEPTQIRETHPEVCFAALNEGEPVSSKKKSKDGIDARLDLLESHLTNPRGKFEEAVETYTEPAYAPVIGKSKRDDILDAMVAALTAEQCGDDPSRLPRKTEPQVDEAREREIEIIYYPEVTQ